MLRRHLSSLKALYERYADAAPIAMGDRLSSSKWMSIGEWITFVEDVGLISSGQIDVRTAILVFMWSRIRSVNSLTQDKQFSRLRHLFFEDVRCDLPQAKEEHPSLVPFMHGRTCHAHC